MLELIEKNELIKEDRPQNNQLGAVEAAHRHLPAPLKDVLEQAIKGFNRPGS